MMEKSIVKMKDIERRYTDIINDYIRKGYWVYTKTMSGHQGEITKVDLTNGEHIIRILIDRDSDRLDEVPWSRIEMIKIYVLEYFNFTTDTLWFSKGNVIDCQVFYQIYGSYSHNCDSAFTDNKDTYMSIANKQWNRYKTSTVMENISLNNYDIDTIHRIVTNKRGYKRCKREDIKDVVRTYYGYRITINGKRDSIRICFPKYR